MTRLRLVLAAACAVLLPAAAAPTATATETQDFCWNLDSSWSSTTQGRSGQVSVVAHCEARADSWRIDVYVNGEWWALGTGGKIPGTGNHQLTVNVPSMPKPNDKRGNFVWAKVTYKAGATWVNVYEEELGWIPCRSCT